jgi:hypothetical protein
VHAGAELGFKVFLERVAVDLSLRPVWSGIAGVPAIFSLIGSRLFAFLPELRETPQDLSVENVDGQGVAVNGAASLAVDVGCGQARRWERRKRKPESTARATVFENRHSSLLGDHFTFADAAGGWIATFSRNPH